MGPVSRNNAPMADPNNTIERLTELEIKLSFQDDALEQLNAVIVRQQQELDQLRRAVHSLQLQLPAGTRALLIGGEPLPSTPPIWWNFVGYSREASAQAQQDWESGNGRFGQVDGFDGPPLIAPRVPWATR